MSTMTDNEIDALLAGITPGEWRTMRDGNQYVDAEYGVEYSTDYADARLVGASRVDGLPRAWNPWFAQDATELENVSRFKDGDADFIAAAPAIVRQLRADVEMLQWDKHAGRDLIDAARAGRELIIQHEALVAERDALREQVAEWERREQGWSMGKSKALRGQIKELRERVTQLAGECVCGHDGKLTSEDCGVHRETANVGNLVRQNDALRERVAQQEQEIVRLASEIKEPRCNECEVVLGDNWCADCAGKADREKMAQQEREIERLKECVRIIR